MELFGEEADPIKITAKRLRLVQILDAAESAGITPLPLSRLHAFAFLSDILSPVWDLLPQEGKLLKRKGGPYYPTLQAELDCLVGMGVVSIEGVGYERDQNHKWSLMGSYSLNYFLAEPILKTALEFPEEYSLQELLREVGYALATLSDEEFDLAIAEDATYADVRAVEGQVIDFAEWKDQNYTANAANYFDSLMPKGLSTSAGQKIQLYVRFLELRANA